MSCRGLLMRSLAEMMLLAANQIRSRTSRPWKALAVMCVRRLRLKILVPVRPPQFRPDCEHSFLRAQMTE